MNVEQLKSSDMLMMECVAGSHMYGINRPESDKDIRGLYRLPSEAWISINEPAMEIADDKQDIKYYELRKFVKLAADCNPNIIEMLFVPDDCLSFKTGVYDVLVDNRGLFVTKKAKHTFLGYSYSQIKRAKGQNKKINEYGDRVNEKGVSKLKAMLATGTISIRWLESNFNKNFTKYIAKNVTLPHPLTKAPGNEILDDSDINSMLYPKREDFCYHIKDKVDSEFGDFPGRPVKINFNLDKGYGVSSVEHTPHIYRLYQGDYGGVFKNGELSCSSIPKDKERSDYRGMLIYNENDYLKSKSNYDSFWEWMANKNDARWIAQERKEMDYDSKNMGHVFRLLMEAKHIAEDGRPHVRLEGDELEFVRNIRSGRYEYEFLMEKAGEMEAEANALFESSMLPHGSDIGKINELYMELMRMA